MHGLFFNPIIQGFSVKNDANDAAILAMAFFYGLNILSKQILVKRMHVL